MPDIDARLRAPGARVADVACGAGWSSIAVAKGYPGVVVDGYDVDEASIELARASAERAGVADRVTFHVLDASGPAPDAGYDLVTIFEALHDLSRPVEALATIRTMARPDGSVLVVDERTADAFTAPGDDNERLFYGWSVLLCLPTGMDHDHPVGTGTAMRADTVRAYASDAGYSRVEVLPVEHELFRLYRLEP
jgi:ubiquinone/menaquinone biosynthesis C-methylase UbiE